LWKSLLSRQGYSLIQLQNILKFWEQVLIASNTGSQLGPYVSGAGRVIWVVGAEKLVKNLEEGMRRIEEHIVPLEEVHMQQLYNAHTYPSKILIVNREIKPGHITIIIVKEELGF
jgi:hypothetical protein